MTKDQTVIVRAAFNPNGLSSRRQAEPHRRGLLRAGDNGDMARQRKSTASTTTTSTTRDNQNQDLDIAEASGA